MFIDFLFIWLIIVDVLNTMKTKPYRITFSVLILSASLALYVSACPPPAYAFSDQELDDILAPIALYPDPLLAEMLPASTYPGEIAEADAWFKRGGTISGVDGQDWDESVKAIAYYPDILGRMAGNLEWTADLGDAFLNQPDDVTSSIQRLRWEARNAGNLVSNDKQQVTIDGNIIEIIPAQPDTMYVPQYDDTAVYEESGQPFITYGFGLPIGGWLIMDFDWRTHHVIYHGWNRPGWVSHARPYVHIPNVYASRSRPFINQTWRHDMSHGDPERFRASHPNRPGTGGFGRAPEVRGRVTTQTGAPGVIFGPRGNANSFSDRGRQSLDTIRERQAPPAAGVSRQPMPAPRISGSAPQRPPAGAQMQLPKTPSVTFGGYRGGSEARAQSLRGQESRQSGNFTRPAAAPPSRGSAPSGKSSSGGRGR